MSVIKKLIGHTSVYISTEVVIMVGGFISFPILTRLLSQAEYGTMSLIGVLLRIMENLSGLGLNHSAQRFFWDFHESRREGLFYKSLFLGSLLFAFLGTLICILIFNLLKMLHIFSGGLERIFFLAALLVLLRVGTKILGAMYRAREEPLSYSALAVLSKYLGLGLIIFFMLHFTLGLLGYYLGLVLAEMVVLVFFSAFFFRGSGVLQAKFSPTVFRQTAAYGFPLIVSGLATILMSGTDRYLIGYFLSLSDVANYSVSYNLCGYLTGILIGGFQYGFIPIVMEQWNRGDVNETHLEIQRVIRLYCMIALPMVTGLSMVGKDIIVLLASEKYLEASGIIPIIAGSSLLRGLTTPLLIGFWFRNKTKSVAILTFQLAGINFLLNFLLIPYMGLYGAAIATLISNALLLMIGTKRASKFFKIIIPWNAILIYFTCTSLMYFGIRFVLPAFLCHASIYFQTGFGVLTYSVGVYAFDRKFRCSANEIIRKKILRIDRDVLR